MWHHFWFLEVSLAGVPLRTVCSLVLAAMLPAALLPGMLYAGEGTAWVVRGEGVGEYKSGQGCYGWSVVSSFLQHSRSAARAACCPVVPAVPPRLTGALHA